VQREVAADQLAQVVRAVDPAHADDDTLREQLNGCLCLPSIKRGQGFGK
jgi:hypothetical protein